LIFAPRLVEREPAVAIDLGETTASSPSAAAFHGERVAREPVDCNVAFDGPRVHELAPRWRIGASATKRPSMRHSGLLLELAARDRKRSLALDELALRDGPRARILVPP
jgi:hypothetical protein